MNIPVAHETMDLLPVIDQIIDLLPEIDPDSTRFCEWIWATRHRNGLNTGGADFTVVPEVSSGLSEVKGLFQDLFKNHYYAGNLFRGVIEEPDHNCIRFYVVAVESSNGEVTVTAVGDPAILEELMSSLREHYSRPQTIKVDTLIGFGQSGPIVENDELLESEQDFPTPAFYPWMEQSIEDFAKEFDESKANGVLLIGPPGTGKSTFLRKLMFLLNREHNGMAAQEPLIMDPQFGPWFRSFRRDGFIGVEDADRLASKRDDGNHQMSMILNSIDGVVSGKGKVVISTNLSTTAKVDDALLRPGRNFAVLEFRRLTAEEANAARESIGLKPAEFDSEEHYTLGEALAHRSIHQIKHQRKEGFGMMP